MFGAEFLNRYYPYKSERIPVAQFTACLLYTSKALANAEPIDVFPLLRPFAIGLCVMFFPTVVLEMCIRDRFQPVIPDLFTEQ